jgi:ESCRT-I complex subunit TSG101
MVQDPRVSRVLARLGGVYRDPARVNRDASSLLKSSVGMHLQPISAVYVDVDSNASTSGANAMTTATTGSISNSNNVTSTAVLVLQGTVAMHFRGNTYQILVDMYIIPSYPNRPPVCYVRLADANMYLKENHRHVGRDGRIYMPYLHEWHPQTHNLVELVVAMSSLFSADPPVFTRPSTSTSTTIIRTSGTTPSTTAQYVTPQPPPPSSSSFLMSSSSNNNTTASMREQLEAIMAAEVAEANAAAEVARNAARIEQETIERQAFERAQLESIKEQVAAKIQHYFREQTIQTKRIIREDYIDKEKLASPHPETIASQIQYLQKTKEDLERKIAVVQTCKADIQEWLQEEQSSSSSNTNDENHKKSIDDLCVPQTALDRQLLELAAQNASITDALYFLDRAILEDVISCDLHLKTVRKLAKQQFLIRAHVLKIQQQQQLMGTHASL